MSFKDRIHSHIDALDDHARRPEGFAKCIASGWLKLVGLELATEELIRNKIRRG